MASYSPPVKVTDLSMCVCVCIAEHYNEALAVIHKMFRHIFDGLELRYAKELAVIR